MILLKNATVVNHDGIKKYDVLIDGDIISKLGVYRHALSSARTGANA